MLYHSYVKLVNETSTGTETHYYNFDQIARVEVKQVGHAQGVVVFFSKPGGSDRQFVPVACQQEFLDNLDKLTSSAHEKAVLKAEEDQKLAKKKATRKVAKKSVKKKA